MNTSKNIRNDPMVREIMERRRRRIDALAGKKFNNNQNQGNRNQGNQNQNQGNRNQGNRNQNQGNQNQNQNQGMRNDNDLNIVERNELLKTDSMMANFDESYYLDNRRKVKRARGENEGIEMMNANGGINEVLQDNTPKSRNELLKKKALDLETLIVERLTRDRFNDARRIFSVLEKMHKKYDDDNVSDVYYRVLPTIPMDSMSNTPIYSYRQNKNNFKKVLDNMALEGDVDAYNAGSPCVSSLGEMWEECDLDICSEKCKSKIMEARDTSDTGQCDELVTGYQDDEKIRMKDDIKTLILDRLKYCRKQSELEQGNFKMISQSQKLDIKNDLIKDIQEMSRLANMHYNSCHNQASEFLVEDDKYRNILEVLKTIDFKALSLERLQEIRNDLTMLPTCDMLKYEEHDKKRDPDVKEGIRVGKYIIPKKTDYYDQIKGKDRPFVYRDIATDKHYLFDSYSKTLTPFEYPMTEKALQEQQLNNVKYESQEVNQSPGEAPAFDKLMYDIKVELAKNNKEVVPAPTPLIPEVPAPSIKNNVAPQEAEVEKVEEKKVLFNLSSKQVLEYLFLVLIIFIILAIFSFIL